MMKFLVCAVLAVLLASVTAQTADSCRMCMIVIEFSRYHFNNTINDQGSLQTELLNECAHLVQYGYTADQIAMCQKLVNDNIDAIYNKLHNNPDEGTYNVCVDFGECAAK